MSILRPGDLRSRNLDFEPEQRMAPSEFNVPRLSASWIDSYDRMSAAEAKSRCASDPLFNELANQLFALRNSGGGQ